ncbi:protein kinase [Lipomyces tetrasporus]|uniref:non-specific serine/threonine protein kinase n=1 Tax=Lipomyces tetrasporus TaxID=54092 RepID=A0AAD7VPI9_9ASCO|nr:protein kinase [Lipomyces tetrasporus]KAJ8096821.1 protein kinase [Lipomyces tetrasporus]
MATTWLFQPSSLDNIEQIENYRKRGFHPVSIGDNFASGRYRILHKLGFGGFSTVWLARDERNHRLVSLKIVTAEVRDIMELPLNSMLDKNIYIKDLIDSKIYNELRILQHLKESAIYDSSFDYILTVLDHFTIEGPNGFHGCLVTPFAGPDLAHVSYNPDQPSETRRLRGALARKFAKQVALAVGYLHSRGVSHGVFYALVVTLDFVLIQRLDLSTSNVLIQLAHVDAWSDQDVYELLGSPVTDRVRLFSGELNNMTSAPEYLVAPANLPNLESKWLAEKILLVDFGQSFMLQQPHNDVGFTMSYCAPEVYFDGKRTVWSDIWALGCMIFEIRAGCQLFESFLGGPHEVILQIVETLGKLPEPWWNSWEKRHVYFDEDGKPIKGPDICFSAEHPLIGQIRDIGAEESRVITDEGTIDENLLKNTVPAEPETESIFEPRGTRLTEAEVEVFADLLRKILKYNPEERLQIEKILKHAWFMTSFGDFSRINGSSIGYND